jgi:DNA-binding Xre family transcriptional regulator
MHIGKEIKKIMEQRGIKATWLAQEISTSRRNLYDILEREDINAGVLAKISKKLGHNFFAYYTGGEQGVSTLNEPQAEYGKLKHENDLLREQLDLTNRLVESKDKLLKEYLKKPKVS